MLCVLWRLLSSSRTPVITISKVLEFPSMASTGMMVPNPRVDDLLELSTGPSPRPVQRGIMDRSRDFHSDLPIEDWRSSLMEKKIDLYNFESCAAEESPYILTSPRSLRACARMKIQPVELLAKPETDFEEELLKSGQQPGEASRKLYDAHERQRLRKLYMCRRAREEIIQEEGGGETTEVIDHAKLLFQGPNKPPEKTVKPTANGIDHSKVIIPKSGQGNFNLRPGASPRPPPHPSPRPPSSRTSASSSKTSSTSSPRTSSSKSSSKTTSSTSTSSASGRRNPTPTDLTPRLFKRSASMPPTSRQRPQSAVSSGSSQRSSRTPLSQRLGLDGDRPSRPLSRSRPYSANLPERDQRILECMVFKREQEKEDLRHQQMVRKVWDEERRKEEKIRAENELQRRKNLVERELDRQKKRERMQKQREKEEKEKLKEIEMSLKYKDAKHVQLASQQDLLKIQQIDSKKQIEKAKKEKQAKALHEKEAKDEEYRKEVEKHISFSLESAEAKRERKQQEEVRELQRKNKEVMKQHAARKKVIDKQTEEENEYQRICIDAKDSKHKELMEQQHFQRQSELRNSRRKLEEQQKKASKTKVVLDKNMEKWKDDIVKHRTVVQEQAVVKAEKVVQEKAQKAQELRIVKEKTHKERIARVAEDAETLARYTEQKIKHKDQKVQEVIAKKQQEIDKSRAVAQNSAKLREQIRNQYTRSFDRMAKKAELESKLGAGPSLGTKNYSHVIIS